MALAKKPSPSTRPGRSSDQQSVSTLNTHLRAGSPQERAGCPDACGCRLEANSGKFGGVIAAEEIEHVILFEALGGELLLGEGPFEVTAPGPVRDVALVGGEVLVSEGGDDVFVRDARWRACG